MQIKKESIKTLKFKNINLRGIESDCELKE